MAAGVGCEGGEGRAGVGVARSVAAVALGLWLPLGACGPPEYDVPGGDPERGEAAVRSEECQSCHTIPGVAILEGNVKGPSLERWAYRKEFDNGMPNEPDSLIKWLIDPHAQDPETAMEPLGLTEQEARDIAAFLYTLD